MFATPLFGHSGYLGDGVHHHLRSVRRCDEIEDADRFPLRPLPVESLTGLVNEDTPPSSERIFARFTFFVASPRTAL